MQVSTTNRMPEHQLGAFALKLSGDCIEAVTEALEEAEGNQEAIVIDGGRQNRHSQPEAMMVFPGLDTAGFGELLGLAEAAISRIPQSRGGIMYIPSIPGSNDPDLVIFAQHHPYGNLLSEIKITVGSTPAQCAIELQERQFNRESLKWDSGRSDSFGIEDISQAAARASGVPEHKANEHPKSKLAYGLIAGLVDRMVSHQFPDCRWSNGQLLHRMPLELAPQDGGGKPGQFKAIGGCFSQIVDPTTCPTTEVRGKQMRVAEFVVGGWVNEEGVFASRYTRIEALIPTDATCPEDIKLRAVRMKVQGNDWTTDEMAAELADPEAAIRFAYGLSEERDLGDRQADAVRKLEGFLDIMAGVFRLKQVRNSAMADAFKKALEK